MNGIFCLNFLSEEQIHFHYSYNLFFFFHRRFVFHSISHVTESQKESLCYQSGSSNNPGNGYLKKFRLDPNSIMPLKELVQNESDFVEEQLKSADSFHQHLAKRYIDWVKTFFPT